MHNHTNSHTDLNLNKSTSSYTTVRLEPTDQAQPSKKQSLESSFHTSFLTTRAHALQKSNSSGSDIQSCEQQLQKVAEQPEFAALLYAAQHLSDELGISFHESSERLIEAFRKLDHCWESIALRRGLETLTGL